MSGNTSGALGFVQGLQGGMDFMDQRRRNKLIDQTLAKKDYLTDLDIDARKRTWIGAGRDPEQFREFEDPTVKDPLAVRGFNWLKSKFGGSSKPDVTAGVVPAVEPGQDEADVKPQASAIPTAKSPFGSFGPEQTGEASAVQQKPFGFADGGKVSPEEEKRLKRSYGDSYVTEEEAAANRAHQSALPPAYQSPYSPYMRDQRGRLEAGRKAIPTSGGGVIEFAKDFGRQFDDTIAAAQDTGAAYEAIDRFQNAPDARAAGAAARETMVETGKQMGSTVLGLGKDLFIDNPITQGVLGFIGFDGTKGNRQADPNTPPPAVEPEKKTAIDAATGGEKPVDKVASDAVDAAVGMTPGHPDNKNQQFDWSEVAASGLRPEDIPPAPVEDWTKYRKAVLEASILRGEDPSVAQMGITQMQMDGFSSNMQQASFLSKQGDPRGAALAARMAYQYFPNGSDVRFGIAEGKNGPVLVGMGVDEKTGEPVGQGTPMVLTPDTLAMYADVARDPKQWLTWTKDWHAMDMKEREFLLDRDIAQVDARYKDRMATAAETNAEAATVRALRTGMGGNIKQSDFRESFETIREGMYTGEIEDEDIMRMTSLATLIRQRVPDQQQLSDDQIIEEVMKYYESDGDASVLSPGVARILGLTGE